MSEPGPANASRLVAVFDSIHLVLVAEGAFKERSIGCDLIPVPKELSADCGMALEFREEDLQAARPVLADARVQRCRLFRRTETGHESVEGWNAG